MKFYLLSDNTDTQMGLRLVGIDGDVVHERNEFLSALQHTVARPDIGIILITSKLVELAPDVISEMKLKNKRQIILEIPDRRGNSTLGESIDAYVSEAIGVKLS
jgi:V/A-type H+-transporting ATPase subunit F